MTTVAKDGGHRASPVAAPGVDLAPVLARLVAGEGLSRGETEELFGSLMDGGFSDVQKTALLVALAVKGETVGELAGAAAAMRRRVLAIPHRQEACVDTCGTGGDGKGSFNISTAAAFVAAAGGAVVAKHGNRSVSSRSGSADVLAALGVEIELAPEHAGRLLDEIGIAFLFAPRLHPAMREVMPVRRELGIRTLFNLLGPLTNPAGARRQVLGVFAAGRVADLAGVLLELGAEHALVVHGGDGLDEITTTGPTEVAEVRDGAVRRYRLTPQDLGLPVSRPEALLGGTPEENAARLSEVLTGRPGPLADVTAANAGAALYVAGVACTLRQGVARAQELLAGGAAMGKLDELRSRSREAPR